jgi:hypothetical protein
MNLGELIDFVGNLLDYDPTNSTYRSQLVSLLNDAQGRLLTDRPWSFSIRERVLRVFTDTTSTATFTNGTATVSGSFPSSSSSVRPGSNLDGALLFVTDSGGNTFEHSIAWVENGTTLYLDRPFLGVTGAYTATIKRRDIFLPSDSMSVENVGDPSVGIPAKAMFLSKFEREDANLDPDLLGTIEAYLPSTGMVVPAPSTVRGVATVASGVSQGVRTINVYMCNVKGPDATNFPVYPVEVSDGFESGLSKVATYSLGDAETRQHDRIVSEILLHLSGSEYPRSRPYPKRRSWDNRCRHRRADRRRNPCAGSVTEHVSRSKLPIEIDPVSIQSERRLSVDTAISAPFRRSGYRRPSPSSSVETSRRPRRAARPGRIFADHRICSTRKLDAQSR